MPAVTKVVFITTVGYSTYTTPSDWGAPWSIEVIGGGAASNVNRAGSGGGGYSKITNADATIAANTLLYCRVGAGGSTGALSGDDTWVNISSNAAPVAVTGGVLAKGGTAGSTTVVGPGGAAASGVGSTKYSGGTGGPSAGTGTGGGGGGAGGPAGAGGSGGHGGPSNGGGGGGGSGATLWMAGTTGSAGAAGAGGAGGASYFIRYAGAGGIIQTGGSGATSSIAATSGSSGGGGGGGFTTTNTSGANGGDATTVYGVGNVWTQSSNLAQANPGGGGGGGAGSGSIGGAGGLYGGAGGGASTGSLVNPGGQGIIVLTYTGTTGVVNRLDSSGNFFVNGEFDEVTSTGVAYRVDSNGNAYATEFDEVTGITAGTQRKIYSNGSVLIPTSAIFDEVTEVS